jgi:hypothetical protein
MNDHNTIIDSIHAHLSSTHEGRWYFYLNKYPVQHFIQTRRNTDPRYTADSRWTHRIDINGNNLTLSLFEGMTMHRNNRTELITIDLTDPHSLEQFDKEFTKLRYQP